MLLRLDLAALGFPFTAFPPYLVGVILLFCGLKLRVFPHGLGVLPVQHFRESLAHARHVRVLALLEVFPRRQILESGHRKAFRAGEGYEGQAMLRRSLESLPTRQIDDNALLEREALRLVHGQRIAREETTQGPILNVSITQFLQSLTSHEGLYVVPELLSPPPQSPGLSQTRFDRHSRSDT